MQNCLAESTIQNHLSRITFVGTLIQNHLTCRINYAELLYLSRIESGSDLTLLHSWLAPYQLCKPLSSFRILLFQSWPNSNSVNQTGSLIFSNWTRTRKLYRVAFISLTADIHFDHFWATFGVARFKRLLGKSSRETQRSLPLSFGVSSLVWIGY